MSESALIPTVLIDTTLQLEQQKIKPRPTVVETALSGFHFRAASSYSRLEAKRAWVQRLAYIHTESKQVDSIPQLLDRITRKLGSHPGHRRRLTTSIEAISSYSERLKGSMSGHAAMERFRYLIVDAVLSLNTWWDRSIHHEFDGTKCVRAKEFPTFDLRTETIQAGIARCVRSKIQCNIHNFRSNNAANFEKIIDSVSGCHHGADKSPELVAAAAILEASKVDATHLCDDGVCAKIGDCLITVDGLKMSHFASTNAREWGPLARTFDRVFLNPNDNDVH